MTGLPSQYQLLSNAIEFANQNHRAISQNLANVNTPNYQTQQVSFEQFLEQVENSGAKDGKAGDGQQLKEFKLQNTPGLAARSDGNNVDLDRELASLKKNDLAHQTLTQLLGSQIGIMKKAISG